MPTCFNCKQKGHIARLCPNTRYMSAPMTNTGRVKKEPELVGETNEVKVLINNIDVNALLDTGSCVSAMSKTFYEENLAHIEIKPLNRILKIECADGNTLPYASS